MSGKSLGSAAWTTPPSCFLEILYMIAFLALISAGLAIVFGMMRVINLAHGEFVMLGGYATIAAAKAGINIYLAMLVIAPIVVGVIGLIVERADRALPLRPHDRHHAGDLGPEPAAGRPRHADLRQYRRERAGADPRLPGRPLPDGRLQSLRHRGRGAADARHVAGAALHPRRPHRARRHAGRRRGGGARAQSAQPSTC